MLGSLDCNHDGCYRGYNLCVYPGVFAYQKVMPPPTATDKSERAAVATVLALHVAGKFRGNAPIRDADTDTAAGVVQHIMVLIVGELGRGFKILCSLERVETVEVRRYCAGLDDRMKRFGGHGEVFSAPCPCYDDSMFHHWKMVVCAAMATSLLEGGGFASQFLFNGFEAKTSVRRRTSSRGGG